MKRQLSKREKSTCFSVSVHYCHFLAFYFVLLSLSFFLIWILHLVSSSLGVSHLGHQVLEAHRELTSPPFSLLLFVKLGWGNVTSLDFLEVSDLVGADHCEQRSQGASKVTVLNIYRTTGNRSLYSDQFCYVTRMLHRNVKHAVLRAVSKAIHVEVGRFVQKIVDICYGLRLGFLALCRLPGIVQNMTR